MREHVGLFDNADNIRYGPSNDTISEVAILKPAKFANVHSNFCWEMTREHFINLGRANDDPSLSLKLNHVYVHILANDANNET